MAQNQHDNIKALRAKVEQLESKIDWMQPKPAESYTAWVERLFHVGRKAA